MVDERGVPVQDDWSMAPDEDRVRFSLSGVTPHCNTREALAGREGERERERLTTDATLPHTQTQTQISDTDMKETRRHTNLLLVHSQFVAADVRFTARLLILLLGKHRGILGK